MRRDEVLRIIREHEPELRDLHVAKLELFGSVARDEAGPESDVDLLVEFDREIGLFHFVGVQQRLEDLLGTRVDLVMRRAVRPRLQDRIYGEAIRVA